MLRVSNIFRVQAVAYAPYVISNTFPLVVSPPEGMQAIKLTAPTAHGVLAGDEWVIDLFTDGGLDVVALPDGTYTVPNIQGNGNQTVYSYGIGVNTGYNIKLNFTDIVEDPTNAIVLPIISVQPLAGSIVEGSGTHVFSVVASGNPAVTYQWIREGTNVVGATQNSLTVYGSQRVFANDGESYRVRVSNIAGSVTSVPAVLSITESAKAPVVTLDPINHTLLEGSVDTITFSVAATAQNAPTVQWEVFKGTSYEEIPGATSTDLIITGTDVTYLVDNSSGYRAKFTNTEGTTITDTAILYVTPIVDEAPNAVLSATNITDNSFNISFTADESGFFKLIVLPNNQTAPTAEEVFSGGVPNISRESPIAGMGVGVEVITPIQDMEVYRAYDVYGALRDYANNYRLLPRLDVSTLRDITPPVIVLNGSANFAIPQGRSFIDEGATVTDNVDPDRQVTGTGLVLHNTIGTYTRYYNATDSAGNVATTVTRRVLVYDPALHTVDGGGVVSEVISDSLVDIDYVVIE
jgi:hypothetical protein